MYVAASDKPSKPTLDIPLLKTFLPSIGEPTVGYQQWVRSLPTYSKELEKMDVLDNWGSPLLFYAVESGNTQIVEWMITMGADIHFTCEGGTALIVAVGCSKPNIVSMLLEQGADINLVDGMYGAALGCAIHSGHVEMLLERN